MAKKLDWFIVLFEVDEWIYLQKDKMLNFDASPSFVSINLSWACVIIETKVEQFHFSEVPIVKMKFENWAQIDGHLKIHGGMLLTFSI